MVHRLLLLAAMLIVPFGIAFASHPGSASLYDVLGFTADGKRVYFKKTNIGGPDEEHWYAVYEVATAKPKTSQPVYRDCATGACDGGKSSIDKKTGEKTIAQLTKTYGAPIAASVVPMTSKLDEAAALKAIKTGFTQKFSATDVEVQVTSKLTSKLADPNDGENHSAQFELAISVTTKGATWTTKQKVYANTVQNLDNGNIGEWPELHVQRLAAAPDRKTIALVFARKPYVIKQPGPKPTK